MRNIAIIIMMFCTLGQVLGQTDKNGNPVFNSVSTNEKVIGECHLISNYYTLKNNIENRQSSVFISEKPTMDQVEKAATDLPSDFFLLTKESRMVAMVMLHTDPEKEFVTIVLKTNQQSSYPCDLKGDITENRANEIIDEEYDPSAFIKNDRLNFNGKDFEIISNQEIEDAVLALIKKEKLNQEQPSDIKLPSKTELKNYIISESKAGGSFDFFTEIKGKEFDGIEVKPGVFTSNKSVALYKWGRACFEIGVNTVEDAYNIYSEFQGNTVTKRDKRYIKSGFNKEWEK